MKSYYLKISGSAFGVEGNTPEEAIESIKNHLHVYCTITPQEIGIDSLGWPIETVPAGEDRFGNKMETVREIAQNPDPRD